MLLVVTGLAAVVPWPCCGNRRVVGTMGLAGAFIVVNWTTFISATLSGHVVEAALGYFINPIVTVLLGVVRAARTAAHDPVGGRRAERRRRPRDRDRLRAACPWISLVLAFSFGLYGLVKKQVGGRVDAVGGLTLETLWIAPFAAAHPDRRCT